jgi:hypothetical protein
MSEPRFVIASTGLCGSGYIAQVLNHAGITCGHESWWNIHGERTEGLAGDSSWLSVRHLRLYRGRVYHQVDHPLKVVSRWNAMYADPLFSHAYRQERFLTSGVIVTELNDVVKSYLSYVRRIEERADLTWRLEDVAPSLVMVIARENGLMVYPEVAAYAVNETPTDYNTRTSEPYLEWADLPDTLETEALARVCEGYGYELEI